MRWWLCLSLLLALPSCSGTRSSSFATSATDAPAYRGIVRVTSLQPQRGSEVGIITVESVETLVEAIEALKQRAAELGGDVAIVDRYTTSYHMETRTSTQSYQCGRTTCSRQVTQQVQVEVLHLQGRAFITRGN